MGTKDYIGPVISTYQFFNLTDEQKKELEELKKFEHWDGFQVDRISKSLEKKLRPIVAKYGTTIKIKNHETGDSLTIESVPHGCYKGPELWFESDYEASEHATCLLPMWKKENSRKVKNECYHTNKGYTIDDLRKTMGIKLTERLVGSYGSEQDAVKWFYEFKIKPYDNMTPYELFGYNRKELEDFIESIEWGCLA